MATAKKSSRARQPSPGSSARGEGLQAQAEQFSRRLGESAQQVWLAGLGALGRAQSEGGRLFDTLVKEGAGVERDGRNRAGARAEAVRDEVESRLDQARELASQGWDRIEKAFDERVRGVLHSLQIPDRAEVDALRRQVESLKAQLRAANAPATRRASRAAPAADAAAERPARRRPPPPRPGP